MHFAQQQDIAGRSTMNKDELAAALHERLQVAAETMSRDELYEVARIRKIDNRSQMTKEELVKAVNAARTNH